MTSVTDWLDGPAFPDTEEENTMGYDPHHPALQVPAVNELEPHLTLQQTEVLIKLYNDGWRLAPGFPQLEIGGALLIGAERTRYGGPSGVAHLTVTVTHYGEMLDRTETNG